MGFYKKILSAGVFLERDFCVKWYSLCRIHHLFLMHLWKKREVGCSQVSRCSRGLSGFTPCKEIDVVLAAGTRRLFVDKQVNHTAACEERSQGLPVTILFHDFHGREHLEKPWVSLWGIYKLKAVNKLVQLFAGLELSIHPCSALPGRVHGADGWESTACHPWSQDQGR